MMLLAPKIPLAVIMGAGLPFRYKLLPPNAIDHVSGEGIQNSAARISAMPGSRAVARLPAATSTGCRASMTSAS